MPVYRLDERLWFPDPRMSHSSGLSAVGGDLTIERLILAYSNGVFPWYCEGEEILWWSPDPRFVLDPKEIRMTRSLRRILKKKTFEVRFDTAFAEVIELCAQQERPDQEGTWITGDMVFAYRRLFDMGLAHSVETFRDGCLVGGLYGICLGRFFFGESMFHLVSDASKVALVALASRFRDAVLIDCQVHTPFFETMGARFIPRDEFLQSLADHVHAPHLWEETKSAHSDVP